MDAALQADDRDSYDEWCLVAKSIALLTRHHPEPAKTKSKRKTAARARPAQANGRISTAYRAGTSKSLKHSQNRQQRIENSTRMRSQFTAHAERRIAQYARRMRQRRSGQQQAAQKPAQLSASLLGREQVSFQSETLPFRDKLGPGPPRRMPDGGIRGETQAETAGRRAMRPLDIFRHAGAKPADFFKQGARAKQIAGAGESFLRHISFIVEGEDLLEGFDRQSCGADRRSGP